VEESVGRDVSDYRSRRKITWLAITMELHTKGENHRFVLVLMCRGGDRQTQKTGFQQHMSSYIAFYKARRTRQRRDRLSTPTYLLPPLASSLCLCIIRPVAAPLSVGGLSIEFGFADQSRRRRCCTSLTTNLTINHKSPSLLSTYFLYLMLPPTLCSMETCDECRAI